VINLTACVGEATETCTRHPDVAHLHPSHAVEAAGFIAPPSRLWAPAVPRASTAPHQGRRTRASRSRSSRIPRRQSSWKSSGLLNKLVVQCVLQGVVRALSRPKRESRGSRARSPHRSPGGSAQPRRATEATSTTAGQAPRTTSPSSAAPP
jgi:hypothetical protein